MTVDGSMIEQVMISNLAAPNSSSVKWIAVQDGVAFWTDSFSCPGLRKFDPKTALLGQRRSTLLEDSTGINCLFFILAANFREKEFCLSEVSLQLMEIPFM